MASPFKVFRKNQKFALALLTILAMFGFVVLPNLVPLVGGRGGPAGRQEVVTTDRYGDLDETELAQLRRERQMVVGFLRRVDALVRTQQQNPRGQTIAGMFINRMPLEEHAIVETWLLTNRADELGVVINDDVVNTFIKTITENAISQDEFVGLLKQADLSENLLFRLLKQELMALRLQDLTWASLLPTTPGEKWDYFQRLNRQMSLELAEVPVAQFVSSVKDPDEETIEAFFNKYKERENRPESSEPGFRLPKRVAIEYFKVDYDHLFTEEELKKYYEDNKEEFKREVLPSLDAPEPASELEESLPGLDDAESPLPPADGTAPGPSEQAPSTDDGPESSETEPAQGEAESAKPESAADNETSAEPKSEAAKPQDSEEDEAAQPSPDDGSRTVRPSPFRLTAFQAEDKPAEDKPADDKPADDKPADDKPAEDKPAEDKPAEDKPAEDKPAEDKPAEDKPAEDKPAEDKPAEDKPAEDKPAEDKPAEDKPAVDEEPAPTEEKAEVGEPMPAAESESGDAGETMGEDAAPEPVSEYYPFEEVKSQIQYRLSEEKLNKLFRPLENEMTIFHDEQVRYIREHDEDAASTTAKPVPPDFKAMAKKAGIEAKKTELFSQIEAVEESLDIADSQVMAGDRPVPFLSFAFDSLSLYRPARSQDREGNHYLFWKTEQTEERVPELDDPEHPEVREMVVGAWKMIQARDEAVAKAEDLAATAREKEGSLAETLAGESGITVEKTEPFTWLDSFFAIQYGMPRLSTVELETPEAEEGDEPSEPITLPYAGTDFMRAVSNLQAGEIGIAWNAPKTVVYVARMVETSPEPENLRQQFLVARNPRLLTVVANLDRRDAFRDWIKSLEESVGLEWHR